MSDSNPFIGPAYTVLPENIKPQPDKNQGMVKPISGSEGVMRIGHMLHELIEQAPSVVYPLKVTTGTHMSRSSNLATFDVLDTETGKGYQVLIIENK